MCPRVRHSRVKRRHPSASHLGPERHQTHPLEDGRFDGNRVRRWRSRRDGFLATRKRPRPLKTFPEILASLFGFLQHPFQLFLAVMDILVFTSYIVLPCLLLHVPFRPRLFVAIDDGWGQVRCVGGRRGWRHLRLVGGEERAQVTHERKHSECVFDECSQSSSQSVPSHLTFRSLKRSSSSSYMESIAPRMRRPASWLITNRQTTTATGGRPPTPQGKQRYTRHRQWRRMEIYVTSVRCFRQGTGSTPALVIPPWEKARVLQQALRRLVLNVIVPHLGDMLLAPRDADISSDLSFLTESMSTFDCSRVLFACFGGDGVSPVGYQGEEQAPEAPGGNPRRNRS